MKINLKELKDIAQTCTLLYVEDEIALQDVVSMYLRKIFKSVDVAKNGLDGLDLYQKDKYDLIITDIGMPKMDGLEMSEKIKSQDSMQNIIIISAYSDPEYFNKSISIGVDGYVLKPLDYEQMNITLYKVLLKINNHRELQKLKNETKGTKT
jgi:YesN/AraC family two-component response regulator